MKRNLALVKRNRSDLAMEVDLPRSRLESNLSGREFFLNGSLGTREKESTL